MKKYLATTISEYDKLNENIKIIDNILDKIGKDGKDSLSYDEREFLKQYKNGNINNDLEKWLLNNDDITFNDNGKKLLYDEFEEDEDIFYNREKLKKVISKHLNKKPFTNNADWGGDYVWNINSNSNFEGVFFYLGDDELCILKRTFIDDEYQDEIIKIITNTKELYNSLLTTKK